MKSKDTERIEQKAKDNADKYSKIPYDKNIYIDAYFQACNDEHAHLQPEIDRLIWLIEEAYKMPTLGDKNTVQANYEQFKQKHGL